LVRRLTELHGGHVEVTSQIGHGSKFVVVLPWVPMPLPGADGMGVEVAPGILSAETRPRAGRILIVEDNITTATALADYMTAHGFQTLVAYNGADAILMTEEYAPDVILMDIQMPGVDGLEATRRIRASSITGIVNTPIVAVTALAMTGDRERCMAAGATDYLSKPVELNIVLTTIQRYLPNTRMPR
jgi:CheY-like chemotaxis protein